jgi:hypothetical protein
MGRSERKNEDRVRFVSFARAAAADSACRCARAPRTPPPRRHAAPRRVRAGARMWIRTPVFVPIDATSSLFSSEAAAPFSRPAAPRGGRAHAMRPPPSARTGALAHEYGERATFDTEQAGEKTAVLRPRPKPKGVGPVTWLALITFGIIVVSLMDSHRRSVRRACVRGRVGVGGRGGAGGESGARGGVKKARACGCGCGCGAAQLCWLGPCARWVCWRGR